jgi:hypothetical protein
VAEVGLIVQGGERLTVEGDYEEISTWLNHTRSSPEIRQFKTRHTYGGDPRITVATQHIVAVIEHAEELAYLKP